ncbi:hypothetical protein [Sinorhizobium meliloti]|uniref:hypothetical protein n=1 Tax=Rhizobium meliloti TaxID=382 RepID=UPI000FE0DF96|nr:hypothetical protein [Sinorhizobium meliloti]RVH23020.1 hypothetical protein CN211_33255 [Sinorhizobium meliloti]
MATDNADEKLRQSLRGMLVMDSHAAITSVPVGGAARAVLIEAANTVFEKIIDRMEPENEDLTRSLWDAGHYIDKHLFKEGMLPMTPDHAV